MAKRNPMSSKTKGTIAKITNITLVVLGFFAVFFSSQSKNSAPSSKSHEDMFGTKVAHADVPAASAASGASGDGGGSGSGGCAGGDGGGCGSSGGDGGGGSGCGCGSGSGE